MAAPGFISDAEMAQLEAQSAPRQQAPQVPTFISDEQMAQLEMGAPQQPERPVWKDALVSAAQGATFGFGDEAAAGIRSVLPGYQDYDSELAAIRGGTKNFSEKHPYIDAAAGVAGAVAMPVGGLAARGTTLAGKAGLAAVEGAGMGATYGFGSGEGGFQSRMGNAATNAAVGGVVSPVAVGGLEVAKRGLSSASDQFLKQAMNVQRSDIQKAAKFQSKSASGETPLISALKSARASGVIGAGDDASNMIAKNEKGIGEIGDKVTKLLKQADAAQTNVNIPAFSRAQDYISKRPYEAGDLGKQLQKRLDVINDVWDGSVSGANELKQQLYKIAYKNNTDSSGLDKALAADLREFIESESANLLGPDAQRQLAALNSKQGEMLTLRDLLQKNRASEEMPGGIAKALRRAAVSPVGGSALGVGLTGLGVVSPAVGATAALAAAASTKRGQLVLSDTAGAASRIAGKNRPWLPKVIGETSATVNAPESEQSQSTGRRTFQQATLNQSAPQARTAARQSEIGLRSNSPSSSNAALKNRTIQEALAQVEPGLRDLAAAMIQVESAGNPNARSNKGATGLMQLMPGTAQELGVSDPKDPKQNVVGGVKYIQQQLNKYGDLALALSAYNYGPGNLDKAIKKAGSAEYAAVRPYLPTETREYVDKITARL